MVAGEPGEVAEVGCVGVVEEVAAGGFRLPGDVGEANLKSRSTLTTSMSARAARSLVVVVVMVVVVVVDGSSSGCWKQWQLVAAEES